jgi:hypothetical protein
MSIVYDRAPARNISEQERDLRRDLALLPARYDCGSVSPATYTVIRRLETELAWLEHRGQP